MILALLRVRSSAALRSYHSVMYFAGGQVANGVWGPLILPKLALVEGRVPGGHFDMSSSLSLEVTPLFNFAAW